MTKKTIYIVGLTVAIVLVALLLLLPEREEEAKGQPEQRQPVLTTEKSLVTVYYACGDEGILLPVSMEISATSEAARVALEKLLAGPPLDRLSGPVPGDVKLLDIYAVYRTVYIDLSEEFLDIPAAQAQMAVDALLATVLPLTDCDRLQILVEGEGKERLGRVALDEPLALPLLNPLPEQWAAIAADIPEVEAEGDTAAIAEGEAEAVTEEAAEGEETPAIPWTCWLPDPCGSGLIAPFTCYAPTLDAPLEQLTFAWKLWSDSPRPIINAALLRESWVEDGVVYLDMDAALLSAAGAENERLLFACLTNTLCGLPEVEGVRILLAGEAADETPAGLDISGILSRVEWVNRL